MPRLVRAAAALAFVLAYSCQPLALDACAVSCEAARAARSAVLAAPCHHTTSCASQISQPSPTGSTAAAAVPAPPIVAVVPGILVASPLPSRRCFSPQTCASPPTQLRI